MGCWPVTFLHALQFNQVLLAHTANRVGGHRKNFKGQHIFNIGLNIPNMRVYNFGGRPSGRTLDHDTLPGDVAVGRGDNAHTNFARGTPYNIWEDKKCPKFGAIFGNFRI